MKKIICSLLMVTSLVFAASNVHAQQPMRIGVFDLDMMVEAMPGYTAVDSLLQLYVRDTLNTQYEFYAGEYKRLDSTYKSAVDTKQPQVALDYNQKQLQQIGYTLQNWQQLSQRQLEIKRAVLARSLYEQAGTAYKKVLFQRNYTLVLKPGTYSPGTHIDNLFISVAKELKLTSLPQEYIQLGDDPDAQKDSQHQQSPDSDKASGSKPKVN